MDFLNIDREILESFQFKFCTMKNNFLLSFLFYFIFIFTFINCSTLIPKKNKIKEVEFDYEVISKNYFTPGNEKPFPLTVQKGNNLFSSTSQDGRYLYFSSNTRGNYDLYVRDLKSSTALSLTEHPSAEYKPTISPDGKNLIYVSEEEDSNGDLILSELNPQEIFKDHFSGKPKSQIPRKNLTNPKGGDIFFDTDPSYSPDGKSIVFSSNRLTPNNQNIIIMDLSNPENIFKITDSGGSQPSYSRDGKKIIYVSYKFNKYGDIAVLHLDTGEEMYITKDPFPDFSPCFGSDPETIIFTSIREDSNGDGKINEKDISRILTKKIGSDKEFFITPSDYSSFDSRYSSFNGGSIIYSASIFNSINIYFFPITGMIPKKESPSEQLKIIQEYLNSEKESIVQLAIDSMSLYFSDHPLFPIYQNKTEILKIQYLWNKRKGDLLKAEMEKEKIDDLNFLYKKILFLNLKNKFTGQSYEKETERLNAIYESKKENSLLYAAFLEAYAESKILQKDIPGAVITFNKILQSFPDYYNQTYIKLKMGNLVFTPNSVKIPEVYINLIEEPILLEDKIKALMDLEEVIKFSKNPKEKIEHCDNLIRENNLPERSRELFKLIIFLKAESLFENRSFQESNDLLNSITDPIPIIDPVCAFTPGCKQKLPCEKDRICSQTHLLKALNQENLGNYNGFFEELKIYLQGFDPELKVFADRSEIEKNFRYFELKAKEYESMGMLKESALNFFYNTENMYLLKEKNLFISSTYSRYGNYYYKKMVDYIMNFARQQAKDERESILNKLNIIGKENLDIQGKYNQLLSIIPKNRITGVIIENLKLDVSNEVILGKPGSNDDALKLIDQHFSLSRPRSRPVLYLASLYGYAYFQIQKSIEMDEYYRNNKSLSINKKEKILEGFKLAENELKWILYADQEFIDAYLLLGYLYQYIDLSKRESLDDSTEGDEFIDIYNRYFPGNNLEKNIDLYKQILTFIGETKNRKNLSDIHLNLGNTYLFLNNYSKANESYKLVSELSDLIIEEVQFNDPKQKALFHFNFSKSLLYNNEFKQADSEFDLLLKLYANNPSLTIDRNLYHQKLSLIYTLKGHANSELKDHNKAIANFSKALSLNTSSIPKLSLYNSLTYNFLMKNDIKEANRMIYLAKEEFKKNKSKDDYLSNFDMWSIVLPEKLRTIGEGKLSKNLPNSLQYLWITGNELLLHSINYDENKLIDILNDRKKFISDNNLYKYNIDSKILSIDKSLLANIYYQNRKYSLSSEIFKELYSENSTWEFLKNYSYSTLRIVNIPGEKKQVELQFLMDELKKYQKRYLETCSLNNPNLNFCETLFHKENQEFDIITSNIYFSLFIIFSKEQNSILSTYYSSLIENPALRKEISKNENSFGKIDKVRFLLNQLEISNEERSEEKFKELDYYVKEYHLKEEEFLLNLFLIKHYFQLNELKKIKKILDSTEENLDYIFFSPVINIENLIEYLDLSIRYHFLNKSYHIIPSLEERKLWLKIIRTFFQYTFDFRKLDTKKDYESLKESYDSFTHQVITSRKNFNQYDVSIPSSELKKRMIELEKELNIFISKNQRFTYLQYLKPPKDQSKNFMIISKIDNHYLFFYTYKNKEEIKVVSDLNLDSFLDSSLSEVDLNSIIIYVNNSDITSSLYKFINNHKTSNFLSFKDYTTTKAYPSITKRDNLDQNTNFEDLYHQTHIKIEMQEEKISDWFHETARRYSVKKIVEKDIIIPNIDVNSDLTDSNLLGSLLKMSNFQSISFISKENKIIFGIQSNSQQNIEETIHLALKKEHINQIKEAIQILKSIDRINLDRKQALRLDLILTRLYSKDLVDKNYHDFFKLLFKNYPSNEDSISIKLEEIKYCYFYKNIDCYILSKELKSILNKSSIDFKLKISILNKINYYENFTDHLYQPIHQNHSEMDQIDSAEDEFLFYSNKILFFLNHFYLDEAYFFLKQLSTLTKDKEEEEIFKSFEKELFLLSNLSGATIDLKISIQNNIYSSILNRNYNQILKFTSSDYTIEPIERFKINLYRTYLSLEIGENLSVSNLYDSELISGVSLYSQLDIKDKLILFYIFSKSILDQKENEITNMVFQLLKAENKISSKLSSQLLMTYAENSLNRGDLKTTKQVIDFFNLNFQNHLSENSNKNRFKSINLKYAYLKENKIISEINDEYLNLFVKIKDNPKNAYVYLNTFLKLKNDQSFTSFHKRELNDLISLVQKLALDIDSTTLFYDFSIYKDKLTVFNERFFPNEIKFNELPTILQISSELIQKTPLGQSIISVFPIGADLIKIKISDNKIIGKIFFNENLKLRNDTFLYYKTIANSGSASILRESLETKLRKLLLLEKKKRTYLYLSSYLIKVPVEFKEEDNYIFIHNPSHLLNNLPIKYNSLFEKNINISIQTTKILSNDFLKKLEIIELNKPKNNSTTNVTYLSKKIYLKDYNFISIDGINVRDYTLNSIANEILLIAGSDLFKTSILKEDQISMIQLLEESHKGIIIYSLTPQFNETDPILFYKEFLNNFNYPVNLKSRYINSFKSLKNLDKKEITYIGYRMSTNCFLID